MFLNFLFFRVFILIYLIKILLCEKNLTWKAWGSWNMIFENLIFIQKKLICLRKLDLISETIWFWNLKAWRSHVLRLCWENFKIIFSVFLMVKNIFFIISFCVFWDFYENLELEKHFLYFQVSILDTIHKPLRTTKSNVSLYKPCYTCLFYKQFRLHWSLRNSLLSYHVLDTFTVTKPTNLI